MLGDLTKIATPELRKMLRRELDALKYARERAEIAETTAREERHKLQVTSVIVGELRGELGRRGVKILWPE